MPPVHAPANLSLRMIALIASNHLIIRRGTPNAIIMSQRGTANRSPLSLAFGGLIAMAVGIGIGRFVYTPILPPMMAALGLSKFAAGLIASANFAGYLAGALGATRASLPGPQRLWLPGALALSAATTAAMGLTGSMAGFLLLRFLGGAASALILILSSALVLDHLVQAHRPKLASLHFAGVGIGIAASAALVAAQLSFGATWASMWVASGVVSLFGAVAVVLLLSGYAAPPSAPRTALRAARDPRLRRMTLAYGLFGFGYVITATFLVAIVRATPAIRPLEPVIWIMVGLAAAPSVLLWTLVGQRIGIPAAFATAALTEAAGVLASVAWPSVVGISLAAALVGGTFMGLTALGLMRGRELAQGDPRPVMAAMTGAFGVGQIIGPALAGVVSDALGGFAVPSLAAAGGLVLAAWLARR
jgi:predicted MFS family arabinose efflux permease